MRRKAYLLLLPLAFGLCWSAWAADDAANVAGTWQMNWQGRQGEQQGTMTIEQNGTKLTGTMQGQRGSLPLSGTVQGNSVSFNLQLQGKRRSMTLAFTGNVDGNKMNGTVQAQGGGRRGGGSEGNNHNWSATRKSSTSDQRQ